MNLAPITFSKLSGPSDERECDIVVNGERVGHIVSRKYINYRPAKHIDFSLVEVVIYAQDEEAVVAAPTYDATSALAAAKMWARAAIKASA